MTTLATPMPTRPKTTFSRLSSVFLVERIEPCLDFWIERLGFEVRLQVDGEDHIEFAILGRDDVEIMYRTRDSVQQDTPELSEAPAHGPWVVLYLEVEDLDELLPRLEGIEVVVRERETILGSKEIFVREPSGRVLAIMSRQ
jgi:hypothetical protein